MTKWYYYLKLASEYVIIVAAEDTDRVGMIGATFSTESRAAEYAAQLNAEADAEADKDVDSS